MIESKAPPQSVPAAVPSGFLERHPSVPYVAPFIVLLLLVGTGDRLAFLGRWQYPLRVLLLAAVLWTFSRHVVSLRVGRVLESIAVGILVFVIWILPDQLFPGYRNHWLLENWLAGGAASSTIDPKHLSDPMVLFFRALRAVVFVAIIEELFWRAWLMRWLLNNDFRKVPLGAYSAFSMFATVILFASEHGPYWDVGLAAGLIYNWWMVRTRSLGDCILAHAVTNGCLSIFVILSGRWEYWM